MSPLTSRAGPVAESPVVLGFGLFEGENAADAAEEVDTMSIEDEDSSAVREHGEPGRVGSAGSFDDQGKLGLGILVREPGFSGQPAFLVSPGPLLQMGAMQRDEEIDHNLFVVTREQHIAVVERGKGVFRIELRIGNEFGRIQVCKACCTFHRMILLQHK
jgi:hypothetical protein